MKHILFAIFSAIIFFSCSSNGKHSKDADNCKFAGFDTTKINYAKGFKIKYHKTYKQIEVYNATGKVNTKYILFPRGTEKPNAGNDALYIEIPIRKICCMGTPQVAMLAFIGKEDAIIGLTSPKYICNSKIADKIKKGEIKNLGVDDNIDVENLVSISPDMMMIYEVYTQNTSAYDRLRNAGVNIVVNAEYLENTPLGKAEWVKFVAAFFNCEKDVSRRFDSIARNYEDLKAKAEQVVNKPSVFVGLPWKDTWWVPAGKSYMATFLKDAGAQYMWASDKSTRSIPLNLEAVFQKCQHVPYWIEPGFTTSLKDLSSQDKRFAMFDAYRSGQVFNNNKRMGISGGNDYWESGTVSPDKILRDMIMILHPDLLKGDKTKELYYFHQLK